MLVTLLLILILIVITLFCWLSLLNPVDIDFHFFGKTFDTDLSTLMISSFVLGVLLVFLSTLTGMPKGPIANFGAHDREKGNRPSRRNWKRGWRLFSGEISERRRRTTGRS